MEADKNKSNKSVNQVQLHKLIFTMNWEDPISDYQALKIQAGDRMMTITSGGCNTLSFLLFDPKEIHAVDINPSQSFLLEMKIAAMRRLNFEHYLSFLGLQNSMDRIRIYNTFRGDLSGDARSFWDQNLRMIEKGFLMNGRYEKFVKLAGHGMTFIQGRKRINGLFSEKNLEEQKKFYSLYWNKPRTKLMFDLFFNKYVLAKRGLKADYFHFDDGSDSFSESFCKRFRKALSEIPVKGNYFLHLYLKGCYRSTEEVPDYLLERNFSTIKSRLDRIKIISDDAKIWLSTMPDNFLNCFGLSNICELMNASDTLRFFREVYRTACPGARICFRNLMIPREVPEILRDRIVTDEIVTRKIFDNDRSFVYGKVAAYQVKK
jgi:S-adenosylmethionine-diacylglycerol 3-amino-3-carboxypropyl transferase